MRRWSWGGILAALGALLVAGTCVRLGFWQLDRLEQRREYNASLQRAATQPPIDLSDGGIQEITRDPGAYLYRPAVAAGVYDHSADLLLRARSHQGQPGVHLVSLFRLEGGGEILVNRGWLPAPDGATADPRPYRLAGVQHLSGSLQAVPDDVERATPLEISLEDGTTVPTYLRLDRTTLTRELGTTIPPLYLQLAPTPDDTELPVEVPPPDLTDEGPHLSYAVQWFSFAVIAFGGFIFILLGGPARMRSRRSSEIEAAGRRP